MAETLAPRVSISASAARRIGEILAAEAPGTMLRVAVSGGGCSGFQYGFTLDDTRAPGDLVFEAAGARVVIDEISLDFMKGSEIDFVDGLIGQSFQIKNPLAKASCGCGTSFSV
ncbi:MAG: iron-sulfur cluster assembly accessory protein [Alphaproteobacteria bacterium]